MTFFSQCYYVTNLDVLPLTYRNSENGGKLRVGHTSKFHLRNLPYTLIITLSQQLKFILNVLLKTVNFVAFLQFILELSSIRGLITLLKAATSLFPLSRDWLPATSGHLEKGIRPVAP